MSMDNALVPESNRVIIIICGGPMFVANTCPRIYTTSVYKSIGLVFNNEIALLMKLRPHEPGNF